jgi:hypothetical protein
MKRNVIMSDLYLPLLTGQVSASIVGLAEHVTYFISAALVMFHEMVRTTF